MVAVIAAAYSRLNLLGFANVDDPWALLKNPLVTNFSFNRDYLKTLAISFNDLQYSPLNTLYFALIYKINGFDPYYYHLFSLLVHFANTLLVLLLSQEILKLFKIDNYQLIAYLTALFWSISPINVEAVAWISASKVVLTTCFILLCSLNFIRIMTTNSRMAYVYCVLAYIMAFLCKEQAIVLPFMLGSLLFCHKHLAKEITIKKGFYYLFTIFLVLLIVFAIITLNANSTKKGVLVASYPLYQRIILICYSLFFYLLSLIVPAGLHFHYPFPMMPGQALPPLYYIFPVLMIVVIVLGYKYLKKVRSNSFYFFCALAFLINIGLCLHLVPMSRPALMADRYMYIPSIFILLALCSFVINFIYNNMPAKTQRLILALSLIYLFVLVGYANVLVYNWTKIYLQRSI